MTKGNLQSKHALGKSKGDKFDKIISFDEPLRVDIDSMFVPHGKDTVQLDQVVMMHTQGRVCSPEDLAVRAAELMRDCAASSVNLTIDNKPVWPPAMGRYYPRVLIRQSRKIVGKILREFAEAQTRKQEQERDARGDLLDKVISTK